MRLSSPQINLITRACMKASRSLIRDFGEIENLQVSAKGPGDFVTSADKRTASSSYKPALLDCGIKINVPPFIESGEKIIIDTRTLEYVKRVN